MMFDDTYRTLTTQGESLFKDRGSKFYGYAFPVMTEEAFKAVQLEIRKQHHDARHHCFAYMLMPDKSAFRSGDDGEPSGTAGKPILNQILSADLTNAGIIVVRYFGGTKLGVSGLINAYKTAAREAIEAAEIVELTVNEVYRLSFEYPLMNEVMRLLKEENLEMRNPDFGISCKLEISIRKKEADRITEKLKNLYGLEVKYLLTN